VDRDLFEQLRALRTEKAAERGVPAYVVFGDTSLRDMARRRPSTREGFLEVRGVGDKKCAEYGEAFLAVIAKYCRDAQVAMDLRPDESISVTAERSATEPRGPSMSAVRAFPLFRQRLSVTEVAERMERAVSTVHGYLADYLRDQQITDPSPWVDREARERIEVAVSEVGMDRLKPVFEQLGGEIDYERIRIVVTCLRNAATTGGRGYSDQRE